MRILLVEDNADHRELMCRALTKYDRTWQVVGVTSGEEALRHLTGGETYNLVLLDYSLPGRDGLEVLGEIRRSEAPPPVVVVTGRGDEQVAVEAMKGGAYDYVVKGEDYLQRLPVVAQRAMEAHQLAVDRKRAELEYKAIVGTAMDGFWIIDAQGRFLDTNDAYCRLIGYSREELLKMKISDIEAKEKPKETARRIQKIMEVGGDRFETQHRCKDGRVVDLEVSVNYNKESGDKLFVFLRDVTQRKQMEEALARYVDELRQLSKQLITVQEAERLRISRELHDEMGQALTMLRINIASIKESLLPGYAKGVKDRLADADALTEKLLGQIHELTLELRPHMLDDLGLAPTLRWYTERLSRRLNIQILFTQKNWKERPDSEISTALFRIIQEALTNAAKHARAKKIRILLVQKQKFIEVLIKDDGRGFDQRKIEKRPPRARGIGLFSMKERAALLNGECTIESHPGKGTRIHISIPRRKAVEKN
jgi:two-component system sensor histidine kinase UhpB